MAATLAPMKGQLRCLKRTSRGWGVDESEVEEEEEDLDELEEGGGRGGGIDREVLGGGCWDRSLMG